MPSEPGLRLPAPHALARAPEAARPRAHAPRTHSTRRSGLVAHAWTARRRHVVPTRRATALRHPAAVKDPASLQHLDPIAQLGRRLELLLLDPPPELLPQFAESARLFDPGVPRRTIVSPHSPP